MRRRVSERASPRIGSLDGHRPVAVSEEMSLVAGVILAGGAGKRLGGEKPFRPLQGKALIEHVIGRVLPQVSRTWISARVDDQRLRRLGLPIVEDERASETDGPLAGMVAGIEAAASFGFDTVAFFPCDVPFLPADLVSKLERSLLQSEAPGIIVSSEGVLQPTIGLWQTSSRGLLRAALRGGRRKLHLVCIEVGAAVLDASEARWPVHAFFNVNTAFDMARAEAYGRLRTMPAIRAPMGRPLT